MEFIRENIKWMKDDRGLPAPFYKIKVPSVSTILSEMIPDPEYESWVLKEGKEKVDLIMKLAGQRGTALHFFFFRNLYYHLCQNKRCISSS